MKKTKFTLAERCALTKEISNAEMIVEEKMSEMSNGTFNGDLVEALSSSAGVLNQARENMIYGKRAEDFEVSRGSDDQGHYVIDNFVESTPENNEQTYDIGRAEEDMYNGINEAEQKLRHIRACGKYGKRCEDINLDA